MTGAADWFALPIQGREERRHLYRWIAREETYVAAKFDDQRDSHDAAFDGHDFEGFWFRQIVQYLDRARIALESAESFRQLGEEDACRQMEMRAQQAVAKSMMTSKGCCESMIRVFGPMPKPGVSSGEIQEWK